MELDNIDAAKKMVQQGFGVALIPYTAVADELDAGLLQRVEIEDAEPLRRQIVAVRRRDRTTAGGAAESFLATLRAMQPELSRSWPGPPRGGAPPAPPTAQGLAGPR